MLGGWAEFSLDDNPWTGDKGELDLLEAGVEPISFAMGKELVRAFEESPLPPQTGSSSSPAVSAVRFTELGDDIFRKVFNSYSMGERKKLNWIYFRIVEVQRPQE